MPTEFKNVYLTEALESIQAEKRVSIQEMDNHTEVLEGALRTKTDNLKEELEASVSLAMKVPILKDVNAMKVADGLLDGDVVQLQGYNSAGDGLHHMRKLSTVDDGTGILLPSGLYANYVKDSRSADKLDKEIYDNEVPKINEEITTIKEEIIGVKEDVYSTLPIGTILAIGHNEIPLGFLLCDGREITESEYPELYRLYGSNIPDYRDMFLRGNIAGREIGSFQGDAIRNITGSMLTTGSAGFLRDPKVVTGAFFTESGALSQRTDVSSGTGYSANFDASRVVPTADENRPKNVSVNFIIKAINVVNPSSAVDVAEELNRKIENLENNLKGGLGGSGYCVLPNGMIFQWGNTVVQNHGDFISFPVSFTTKESITITAISADYSVFDGSISTLSSGKTVSNFPVKWNNAVKPIRIMWHALGY